MRQFDLRTQPLSIFVALAAIVLIGAQLPAAAVARARNSSVVCASTAAVAPVDAQRHTLRCLINSERRDRGLTPLRPHYRLRRAAQAHAEDMVRRTYFSHESLGGWDLLERVYNQGYTTRAASWSLGEALAWGIGNDASPRALFAALMDSPPHRAIILERDYRDLGIGLTNGTPGHDRPGLPGITITLNVGRVTFR